MKNEEAAEALRALDDTRRNMSTAVRPPVLLVAFAGLSYGLMVFGWGMTEHENLWALAMYGGAIGLVLSAALYHYTFRLLGRRLSLLPRSAATFKFQFLQATIFGALLIAGRQVRLAGFEFAPHIAALCASVLFAVIAFRYPTGEYIE